MKTLPTLTTPLLGLSLLSGCTSLKIDTSGSELLAPLCQPDGPQLQTLVLWGTAWPPEQQEPHLRELMAQQGIEQFIDETSCVQTPVVIKINTDDQPAPQLLSELTTEHRADQVLFVRVRELGSSLALGMPALIEGYTEVILDVQVFDATSLVATSDTKIHWREGGQFAFKGVSSLPDDMAAALHAALDAPQ